jgi:pimeloyl-ACP methyl ester carboxylesterase
MKSDNISFKGYQGNVLAGALYRPPQKNGRTGILLCHGLFSHQDEFKDLPALLANEGFVVFSFDYSGFGKSTGTRDLFTRASHMADTKAALDELKKHCESIGIFGHSFGGYAALSADYDPRIKFVVLYGVPHHSGANLKGIKKIGFILAGSLYKYFGNLLPDIALPVNKNGGENAGKTKINVRSLAYCLEVNNRKKAAQLPCPALVFGGDHDKDVSIASIKQVHDVIPTHKKLCILAGAGHSPFGSVYAHEVALEIRKFVNVVLEP